MTNDATFNSCCLGMSASRERKAQNVNNREITTDIFLDVLSVFIISLASRPSFG